MQRSVFYSCSVRIIALWLHGAIFAMTVHGNAAENSAVKFAPPSNWVRPHFFDQLSATNLDAGTDQHVLLLEQQINAASSETFVHSIRQILTTDGRRIFIPKPYTTEILLQTLHRVLAPKLAM